MSTFKSEIFEICADVAATFHGWSFASGKFKNSSLKHTDMIVHLGFGFKQDTTAVSPSINLFNKQVSKLCKQLLGMEANVSIVNMQVIAHLLEHTPEKLKTGFWIAKHTVSSSNNLREQAIQGTTIDIGAAHSVLTAILKDAIAFIEAHYDLRSEPALLTSLPAKYTTRHVNSPYDQFEMMKGVMLCFAHLVYGDFDFVLQYRDDTFETRFPKRADLLDKIIAALPDLEQRYKRSGSLL